MTKTTVLLYWLLVTCGLVGITYLRIDDASTTVPLWIGTIVGVGIGQSIAWLRVRPWLIVVGALAMVWLVSATSWLLPLMSDNVKDFLLAFVPAAICGWLSLSERAGLASLWFPSVLWMLVILDDPRSHSLDFKASAPFVAGFGLLFVAFLRARETRRVAIWKTAGSTRLAKKPTTTMLSASPMRGASDFATAAVTGAGALVIASWIAPHMWHKQDSMRLREKEISASIANWTADPDAPVCCPEDSGNATRISEYLPLLNQEREDARRRHLDERCTTACRNGIPLKFTHEDPVASSGKPSSTSSWGSSGLGLPVPGGFTYGGTEPVILPTTRAWINDPLPSLPATPTPPPVPVAPVPVAVASEPDKPITTHSPTAITGGHAPTAVGPNKPAARTPRVATRPTPGGAAPIEAPSVVASTQLSGATAPAWEWALTACGIFVLLQIASRGVRRAITLRHLDRPFWNEGVDQRISNHWHRMLIGLRDAGIHPRKDEQPNAFARRVGIEGMTTCATILERVRHGVRLAEGDLVDMRIAATHVYRAARKRAGFSGRLASQLRSPLA